MAGYCDCHLKHSKQLADLERHCSETHDDHGKMWDAIKAKIDTRWLLAFVPIFLAWMGFQVAVFNTLKTVEKNVAVIQVKIENIENKGYAK